MSSSQGPKRKNGADELTGREKKKQRMNVARTIPVQPYSVVCPRSGVVNGAYISLHPGVWTDVRARNGRPAKCDRCRKVC